MLFPCAFAVCLGTVAYYRAYASLPTAYETSRVFAASFSAGVALFVAIGALMQYRRNSENARIERSMSFWRRSNTREYTDKFDKFVNYWIRLRQGQEGVRSFRDLAATDVDCNKVKISIEYILDFYDEACAAAMMGACDEDALRFYLGALMESHAKRLAGFVKVWREKYRRSEKWNCYTAMIGKWLKAPRDWKEVIGEQPDLDAMEHRQSDVGGPENQSSIGEP